MSSRPHLVRLLAVACAGALLACGTTGGAAVARTGGTPEVPTRATAPGVYVVTLTDVPAAAYSGRITGYRATRPAPGHRFDRTRDAVRSYRQRLLARQDGLLHAVGDPTVLYRYTTALDGFAARLTTDQVKRLRASARVALVERSTTATPDSVDAPDLLGPAGRGAWARAGGSTGAGRGMVVGVVDSGIWPENPSFAGLPQRTPGTAPHLPGFHGACADAEQWTAGDCNDKVISARWFVRGFGAAATASSEYLSPRDGTGHGSHAASTAAGDHGVRVHVDGQGFGTTSGMAPAARIAVYKACWTGPDPADDGCTTADTVAAVDQAVADGVDVLSYSVSGSQDPADSVERAFLGAASAGVFVAASAGNHGPGPGTAGHAAPWVTTVGASTHHLYPGGVRLGDGSTLPGSMVSDSPVRSTGLVRAADVAAPGASRALARLCAPGSLDAERAEGKVVVCARGTVAREDKSAAVFRAGGAGMVLVNTGPGSTDADVHAVPTVHLDRARARTLLAYLRSAGDRATAALDPSVRAQARVPALADFSGRGPVGDVLKPDLTAPGVAVLGAVAPPSDSDRLWDLLSGTSASAPHVAGLAAFVRGEHPRWSPARVKSAMMTTARDLVDTHAPAAEGAGNVAPARFLDPGLVLDSGPTAWRAWLAGRRRAADLNLPSVTVPDLVGRTTVHRRLTNVSGRTETYSATATGLRSTRVDVTPRSITLRPGQTRTVRIRLTASRPAGLGHWDQGWLTWAGPRHRVRLPVLTRPSAVAAPARVTAAGDAGRVTVRARSGTGRPVPLRATRLVPARPTGVTLVPGAFDPADPQPDPDTYATAVRVPAGTDVARFRIESHNPGDDVDLYLYRRGVLVGSSTAESPDATITVTGPRPGAYTLYAHAHTAGNGATTTSQLYTWLVDDEDRDGPGVTLTPRSESVAPGAPFRYTASWGHLDPTQRWLGVVRYGHSDRRTLLQIG